MTRASNPQPSISVVIPSREGRTAITAVMDCACPASRGGPRRDRGEPTAAADRHPDEPPIRWISVADPNLLRLRARRSSWRRARSSPSAKDHALPRPGWCEGILRAHAAEHPEAAAIDGCLTNATTATVGARANFPAFGHRMRHRCWPSPPIGPHRPRLPCPLRGTRFFVDPRRGDREPGDGLHPTSLRRRSYVYLSSDPS